ncbi:hypothetical protein BU25DRAFT_63144 [Macroventuria anomochaeta]|uniref:Uncharacterized protein n=1 Tax=Macroventuria anomochaeta TaxID=301207 RepID=A0ACB6RZJ8_9PLEO|nr:uncharacterized protein BU25DRAFT_63144 [Macroventuria anomochaeta]KAF2627405.1 hypothetical protein BU25DRAFT_63144 [Macroventuria anomochaeta]
MAATTTTTLTKGANIIGGDQELTIKICDIINAEVLAKQVLELRQGAAKITSIQIDVTAYFQAVEELEQLAIATEEKLKLSEPGENTSAAPPTNPSVIEIDELTLCTPLITILDFVKSHNGGLKSFTWPAPSYTGQAFTRPQSFWTALYAHAPTLEKLYLDFFCHEVHTLQPFPSNTVFPALKELRLDTSSAHGDDGSTIDALLHACPNLETLHFEWPPCDLESCQIQNITWGWTFPNLAQLHVFGWNFTPALYTSFLLRHPSLVSLSERVDGPCDPSKGEAIETRLPPAALPNLKSLIKDFTTTHRLSDYFDPAANRPLTNLTIHLSTFQGVEQDLFEIAMSPVAQTTLLRLEFCSDMSCWREHEVFSSSSDSDETASERQAKHIKAQQAWTEIERKRAPNILKTVLPSFVNLDELCIEMDSSNGTWDSSSNTLIFPDAMHIGHLIDVFELLPKSCESKLRLLRMIDSRAKPLEGLEEYLGDMAEWLEEGESLTGSLQVVEWCGEKKSCFDLS